MTEQLRILLVEDNPGDARLAVELLKEGAAAPFELVHAGTLAAAFAELERAAFDVVLLDLSLPDAHGLAGVCEMYGRFPKLPIVVLSGLDNEAVSVEALQNGAQDYLVKGQGDGALMARSVRYAIERKRVQLQLVTEKERAELASRTKSEFLANMSHELRTPLNAIIGFSELIAAGALAPGRSAADYAHDIHASGVHLLNIINDILDLSKIEAGRLELQEDIIDLGRSIDVCLAIIAERVQEGGLRLTIEKPPELPPIRADERKLKQILLNLLSNAVKFTEAGGEIGLKVECTPDGLILVVRDTGIGIAENDIPKALSPFVQIDSSLGRRYPGTGLGLSLTKSLVELHGGSFEIRSTVGVGTEVYVRLPADRLETGALSAA